MNLDLILPTIRIPDWLEKGDTDALEEKAVSAILEKRHDIHDFLFGMQARYGTKIARGLALAIMIINEATYRGEVYDCPRYVEEIGGFLRDEPRTCCEAHSGRKEMGE